MSKARIGLGLELRETSGIAKPHILFYNDINKEAWMLHWLLPFIFGCAKQKDTAEEKSCTEGHSAVVLITELVYTLPDEEGRINGFDLDQYVTESGDDEGCGHEDMISPDGVEGIDSAFSKLAPVLDMIGASQVQD